MIRASRGCDVWLMYADESCAHLGSWRRIVAASVSAVLRADDVCVDGIDRSAASHAACSRIDARQPMRGTF